MAARRRRSLAITRRPTDEGFEYLAQGRRIRDAEVISRIEALAIPPAWQQVEISRSPNAKVLARGVDAAGRLQTIYHPSFRKRQDRQKFERMSRFGKALPRLRARVDRDLRRKRLSRDRVTACVIRLIDLQFFRVGSSRYARQHKSYGVTTLRQGHVSTTGNAVVEFDFVGKSGKRHRQSLRDPRVARLISQLVELPGSEVFRFFDEDDVIHRVRSRHVNAYVKRHMGSEFTAKDFRTWGATVVVATELLNRDPAEMKTSTQRSAVLRQAIVSAAERLGNTPAVTRSSYVDPRVLASIEKPRMLQRVRAARIRAANYLSVDEQRTLKLIKASNETRTLARAR